MARLRWQLPLGLSVPSGPSLATRLPDLARLRNSVIMGLT